MAHGEVSAIVPAPAADVFDLVHDYERRLTWDTLLSAAYLTGGATRAGVTGRRTARLLRGARVARVSWRRRAGVGAAPLAQLDRATASGAVGQRFESSVARPARFGRRDLTVRVPAAYRLARAPSRRA